MATEAEKILPRILPYLEKRSVLEIGCGPEKVVPWAVSVDSHFKADIAVDASPDSGQLAKVLGEQKFDVVFSSHTLEHIRAPILETLRYWVRFVKADGLFILYLPSEERYKFDPSHPTSRNPEHFHYLTPGTFRWYLDQLQILKNVVIEEDPVIFNRYSFLVIAGRS